MKEWICIYCGTTMSSKCPGQRSEFFGAELSMIRNALATHVLDVSPGKKEVFLNLSFWGENTENVDPVLATIKQLSEWQEKLAAVTCDHHFVINSRERTECQLGHEHHNLNDKEELLAERRAAEPKVDFESVKKTYIEFLGDQMNLAKSNLKTMCPNIRQDDPSYDEFRRWYFVFQDEMDQIKYDMQRGMERLSKDQPYRKKYAVTFSHKSDIPTLYTDDILQAEAVWKYYRRSGVKCEIRELRPREKDSTSIQYELLEKDPELRLRCCSCKEFINPGEAIVMAELYETDKKGRDQRVHNHGEVMHKKCHKKITDLDKIFHRTVLITMTDEEMSHFSHRSNYSHDSASWDIDQAMKQRWRDFRYMEITAAYNHRECRNQFRVTIKGLGRHFDELKHYLKLSTKKETK